LQKIDHFNLVIRFRSAEKGGFLDGNDLFGMTEIVKFAAGIALPRQVFIWSENPNAPTDAFRRSFVIASYAQHANASSFTSCDRIARLWSRWVQHPDQRDESEIAFKTGILCRALRMIVVNVNILNVNKRKSQSAQSGLSIGSDLR
jgi:hypothetical protein